MSKAFTENMYFMGSQTCVKWIKFENLKFLLHRFLLSVL